jgi:hypothetical protein
MIIFQSSAGPWLKAATERALRLAGNDAANGLKEAERDPGAANAGEDRKHHKEALLSLAGGFLRTTCTARTQIGGRLTLRVNAQREAWTRIVHLTPVNSWVAALRPAARAAPTAAGIATGAYTRPLFGTI